MKSLGWITKVANYSHLDQKTLTTEQKKLHKMLVYPSHSSDPNYKNINKEFLKELKNQTPEHKQIVLSWLDHGLFSEGWGLLNGQGHLNINDSDKLSDEEKEQVIQILKTIKTAFADNKFIPWYIGTAKHKGVWTLRTIDDSLKRLGVQKEPQLDKIKAATEKLVKGEKLPRLLKKAVKKSLNVDGVKKAEKNPQTAKFLKAWHDSHTK